VKDNALAARVAERLARAGTNTLPATLDALVAYLTVLARWNQRINLTAFALDPPTDGAIDRLIVEPVVAAKFVRAEDRVAVDVGSGGGSPAIPLLLTRPALKMHLVESRSRKASFLREALRHLKLDRAEVVNDRLETMASADRLARTVDVVTLRAVRLDEALAVSIKRLLRSTGQILWFTTKPEATPVPSGLSIESEDELTVGSGGRLLVIRQQ
jgi:16S rRNA (guanine527-N7)-methyltransferase